MHRVMLVEGDNSHTVLLARIPTKGDLVYLNEAVWYVREVMMFVYDDPRPGFIEAIVDIKWMKNHENPSFNYRVGAGVG